MTEADWLARSALRPMLEFLQARGASPRKLRLFGVGCCRRVWAELTPRAARHAVEVSERYADGHATRAELRAAYGDTTGATHAEIAAGWAAREGRINPRLGAAWFAALASSPLVGPVERARDIRLDPPYPAAVMADAGRETVEQARLLRCLFGNPFRPVSFDPDWRTSTALALAEQMYETRDFALMPILGDALMDAGCEDEQVLDHCRGGNEHHRGCWVVDSVLGKT